MQDPRLADTFAGSETAKYLALTLPYLVGNGVDLGSGGWPVVPWAIQVEQTPEAFKSYTGRRVPSGVQWLGSIIDLPFKNRTLDWVYASHLIEDFCRENTDAHPITWHKCFEEWRRVLKPGGLLVVLVPDCKLWGEAIARGQTPNCAHFAPEPSLGDLSRVMKECDFEVVEERMTALTPEDWSILGVGRRPS